jgi:hypothetical protein
MLPGMHSMLIGASKTALTFLSGMVDLVLSGPRNNVNGTNATVTVSGSGNLTFAFTSDTYIGAGNIKVYKNGGNQGNITAWTAGVATPTGLSVAYVENDTCNFFMTQTYAGAGTTSVTVQIYADGVLIDTVLCSATTT